MLKNQKYLFNLKEGIHYLNCAYKAPLLKSAEEAAIKALIRERNPFDITPTDFFKDVDKARQLFGELVNCMDSEVAIIPSTSYGLSTVLNNITCKHGQHAITIENDFPSDYYSIKRWCDRNKAKLNILKPNNDITLVGSQWNNKIIDRINEKTAVVLLSSIHWTNGLKFDLEKIGKKCSSVGAKFIVDGTQSVGVIPMDVEKYNIDALICATYKWLLGPYSLVFAFIGPSFNKGIPLEEAWMNRTNALDFSKLTKYDPVYKPNAGRYNVGETSNFILMPMIIESLTQIKSWSTQEIQDYCKELIQPLVFYLNDMDVNFGDDAYFSPHLFGLNLPQEIDPEILKQNFIKNNIYISARDESIRVSVNVFNTTHDIEALIGVMEETRKMVHNKNRA